MDGKGFSGGQYRPLSNGQIETIHKASLKILSKTGIAYESGLDEAVKMLEKAGAAIDRGKSRIFFPENLIASQVSNAPGQVILFSRDGKNDNVASSCILQRPRRKMALLSV